MTGLEKMIDQIRRESDQETQAVLERARKEADQILAKAKDEAQAQCDKIRRESASHSADQAARAKSAAELAKRRMILSEKQKLIGEVIEEAKKKLAGLPDAEYFDIIVKMAVKSALGQEGEILFSKKDLGRLPKDFEKTLNAALAKKGGRLKISRETRPIDGGFILVYGGVEENCSFKAMFDAAHEVLQDKVQELLFS